MEQKIRELAYEIWEKAGSPESDGIQYWLQAESELTPMEFSPQKRLSRKLGPVGRLHAAKVSPGKKK
jgi:hypothetical protein